MINACYTIITLRFLLYRHDIHIHYMFRRDHHHYLNSLSFSPTRNLYTIKPLPTFPFLSVSFLTPSPTNPFMSICLLPGFFLCSLDDEDDGVPISQLHMCCCCFHSCWCCIFIFNRNSFIVIAYSHIFICMTTTPTIPIGCYFGFKWITNFESDDCAIADEFMFLERRNKKKRLQFAVD